MKKDFTKDEVVFLSDTHFGHANIINYCSRPFTYPDIEEMDLTMLSAMQDADAAGKTIIHAGDFVFRPTTLESVGWRPKGDHIILLGNHDKHANKDGKYRKLYREFFGTIEGHSDTWRTNFLSITVDGEPIMISHEPQQQLMWHKYNLYGHHHSNMVLRPVQFLPTYDWLFKSNRHFNISVELTNYKPVSLDEALTIPMPVLP
jgi:calcineurin-like phosphoesterase family protein